ncbi:MAG TPA: hypothetical protein DEB39_09300 [Planctomycetaceae bacterium]|nr:hypothetical protein [Planctomycetaceae bacterium]
MAFDIEKWINTKANVPYDYFPIGGEVVLLRPLNGLEWDQARINENSGGSFYLNMLQFGLLHPDRKEPYTAEIVTKLLQDCPAAAMKIANRIREITVDTMMAQKERLEHAEKNSLGTGPSEPGDAGATITASPPSGPNPTSAN